MFVTILVFLAVLGLLVFIHELGHFLAARRSGVRVEEFAFGFRPRLFSRKIGDTLYAINLIPLGGYVRMYGENEKLNSPQAFSAQGPLQKFRILIAGSVMNLALGWLIFTILFAVGFNAVVPGIAGNPFVDKNLHVRVTAVSGNSPAALAHLQSGDEIISVNSQMVRTDIEFVTLVNSQRGNDLRLAVNRNGRTEEVTVNARKNPPANEGPMGVTIESVGKVKSTSVWTAPLAAVDQTVVTAILSVRGFLGFIRDLFIQQKVSEDVTGIVGVGALTGIARRLGFEYLAQLVAIISIGLGVINLMPILPLDGGHVAVLAYEKVFGRPINERQLGVLTTAGLAFVLIIFLVVTYKDIIRFQVFNRFF